MYLNGYSKAPHCWHGGESFVGGIIMLSMSCACVTVCEEPMCASIFPKFSEMLEDDKYHLAIRVISWSKKLSRYYNIVDFVFCEIYTEWIKPCMKFYDDNGPALIDNPDVTQEMLDQWDTELCACLELAYDNAWERDHSSWRRFRCDFLYMIGKVNTPFEPWSKKD